MNDLEKPVKMRTLCGHDEGRAPGKFCPKCGTDNHPDWETDCTAAKHAQAARFYNPERFKFCPHCGKEFSPIGAE